MVSESCLAPSNADDLSIVVCHHLNAPLFANLVVKKLGNQESTADRHCGRSNVVEVSGNWLNQSKRVAMTGKRSHDVNLVKGRSNGRVSDLHLDPVLSCVTLDRRVATIKLVVVLPSTLARHCAWLCSPPLCNNGGLKQCESMCRMPSHAGSFSQWRRTSHSMLVTCCA